MRTISLKYKKFKNVFEFAIPLFPVLAQYKFGFFSGGIILLVICVILELINNQGKISFDKRIKYFFYFLIFVISRDIIRCFLGSDPIQTQFNRIIEYTFTFALVFILCSKELDLDSIYRSWKFFGSIYCIGLIYHVVLIYIFSKAAYPISIFPGYILRPAESVATLRPTSFFAEPASFSDTMLPLEFMALKRKDIKIAAIVTAFILLSTSSVGIILSVILWILFLLEKNIDIKIKIFTIVIAFALSYLFIKIDVFRSSFDKLINVANGGSTVHSRITGSFDVVKSLDPLSLVFGTNYNEVNNYIAQNIGRFPLGSEAVKSWSSVGVFLNTISRTIFMYGIVGLLIFLLPFVQLLKKPNYLAKHYVIIILVATFVQSLLLNPYYFMVVILVLSFDKSVAKV